MNKKTFALALSAVFAVSALAVFAGCGGGSGDGDAFTARLCYDNLNDGLDIPASATRLTVGKVTSRKEYNIRGQEVENGTVVELDGNTVKAVGRGYTVLTLEDGTTKRVEVSPAYAVDPDNEFSMDKLDTLLGTTHDPSLIEVEEEGQPAYYIFSTGWAQGGNEIRRSADLIHWTRMGTATTGSTAAPKIVEWIGESMGVMNWWAPDIVPAPDGGYWLYTCCVSSTDKQVSYGTVSKACIVLFHSKTLAAGSFEYVGVLMQSCIPKSGTENDVNVNSIDPQIIYSPDGKMYMAYGSFGTGNWMLELNPQTGLRADGVYADGNFLSPEEIQKNYREANSIYKDFGDEEIETDYYGTMISRGAMEAPVIARHDNVTVSDENGKVLQSGKTFYYSMHSYNPLDVAYQMWGGRSESVWGLYRSTVGTAESFSNIYNGGVGSGMGNKYMGRFRWADKTSTNFDIVKPGHNDLFTTSMGTNIAAYITRTDEVAAYTSQTHQYYLNSMGDIVINPNRYAGEVNRAVSEEELFKYTKDRTFKMVVLANDDTMKTSVYIKLDEGGKLTYGTDTVGEWKMYGSGYIYFRFTDTKAISDLAASKESIFYGVVRPAWLDDQNCSGFTITCMGHTPASDPTSESNNDSFAMFMNNVSTIEGSDIGGNKLSK